LIAGSREAARVAPAGCNERHSLVRADGLRAARGRVRARAGASPRLSESAGDPRRAVRARRLHQHHRAHPRAEAQAAARQAVRGREPAGRRRHDGGGRRRPRHRRRLHHHDGVEHRTRDQRQCAQAIALRSAQGHHADRAGRAHAVRSGGQSRSAGALGRRSGQARAREARPDIVRFGRPRHDPSSQCRTVQEHLRARCGARAVQGHRAGVAGCRRRPRPVHVQRRAAGAAADCGRTGARARRHYASAGQGHCGRSAACRGRHPELQHRLVAFDLDLSRRTEGDRRQARPRDPRDHERSRRAETAERRWRDPAEFAAARGAQALLRCRDRALGELVAKAGILHSQ
jgi:hypothetical protein